MAGASKGTKGRYSVFLGHIGAACVVLGITGSSLWKEEVQILAKVGDYMNIGDYGVEYVADKEVKGANYSAKQVQLNVFENSSDLVATLYPQYRTYEIIGSSTSEKDIYYNWLGDFYAAIGETAKDGRVAIRLYFQPMISFIWIGCVLMTVGVCLLALVEKNINQKIYWNRVNVIF